MKLIIKKLKQANDRWDDWQLIVTAGIVIIVIVIVVWG